MKIGTRHSKETREKMSIAKKKNPTRYWLGRHRSEETKKKMSENSSHHPAWNKGMKGCYSQERLEEMSRIQKLNPSKGFLGKKHNKETKKKMSYAKKINPTKYWLGKKRSKETCENMSKGKKGIGIGRRHTEDSKRKMSVGNKGKVRSEELKKEISRAVSKLWENPEYRNNQSKKMIEKWQEPEYARRAIYSIMKANHSRPNKCEAKLYKIINSIQPNEWKYTGDGSMIINRMTPDFTNVNGRKEVIEHFGDYWHKGENPQDRINKYKKFGYRCLVIWESELKNETEVINKIEEFQR